MDHCWHQDWSNDSGEMNFKTSQSYYYGFEVVLNLIFKFVFFKVSALNNRLKFWFNLNLMITGRIMH